MLPLWHVTPLTKGSEFTFMPVSNNIRVVKTLAIISNSVTTESGINSHVTQVCVHSGFIFSCCIIYTLHLPISFLIDWGWLICSTGGGEPLSVWVRVILKKWNNHYKITLKSKRISKTIPKVEDIFLKQSQLNSKYTNKLDFFKDLKLLTL